MSRGLVESNRGSGGIHKKVGWNPRHVNNIINTRGSVESNKGVGGINNRVRWNPRHVNNNNKKGKDSLGRPSLYCTLGRWASCDTSSHCKPLL